MKGFGFFAAVVLLSSLLVSCTKSGSLGGASSGNGSSSGSLSGSVNGGLSPISGATVSLYLAGNPTPLASAKTTSTGAFTFSYNNPGSGLLYVMATGGTAGSNAANSTIQIGGMLGLASNAPSSIVLNEATTAALINVAYNYGAVQDSNGTVTFKAVNSAGMSSMIAQYNNLIANGTMNGALSTANQNALGGTANALAACIENSANCGTLFNNAVNASQTAAVSIQDALYNIANATVNVTNLYKLAATVSSTTGLSMPGSNQTLLNIQPVVTQNTFTTSGAPAPYSIAIDASGNAWVTSGTQSSMSKISPSGSTIVTTNSAGNSGVAIDAAGNIWAASSTSNSLTELNSSGTAIGTFSIGSACCDGIAIDATGNIWAAAQTADAVVKLNSSGTLLGTFTMGGTQTRGIVIDGSGNAWVAVTGINTVKKLNPSGTIIGAFSVGSNPRGIAIDASGNVWLTAGGVVTELSALSGTTIGNFTVPANPFGVVVDGTGNNIWAGLQGNGSVVKLNSLGTSLAQYSLGGGLSAVAVDASGNVWGTCFCGSNAVFQLPGAALGPQFTPYSGPIFAFGL